MNIASVSVAAKLASPLSAGLFDTARRYTEVASIWQTWHVAFSALAAATRLIQPKKAVPAAAVLASCFYKALGRAPSSATNRSYLTAWQEAGFDGSKHVFDFANAS